MDLRSNLSKARGLGSAHEGVHHWKMQRVTAIALIPLVIWFVISVIKATSADGLTGVLSLLSSPFNAIALILFLGVAIYHGTLGFKVIIEDYVHCHLSVQLLDIFSKFAAVISIVAVTFTIFFVHVQTYKAGTFQPATSQSSAPSDADKITDAPEVDGDPAVEIQKTIEPIVEIETPKE